MKYLILFLISFNVYSEAVNHPKKCFYKDNYITCGHFSPEEIVSRDFECEAANETVFKENYKLNANGTIKCPVEPDATRASESAAKQASIEALDQKKKDMEFGKELYAKIMLMNQSKGLTKNQRKAMRAALSEIRDDMFDGDICGAKEGIDAITPDEMITAQDKAGVLALIAAYKSCS